MASRMINGTDGQDKQPSSTSQTMSGLGKDEFSLKLFVFASHMPRTCYSRPHVIRQCVANGWLCIDRAGIRASHRGIDVLDSVLAKLIA